MPTIVHSIFLCILGFLFVFVCLFVLQSYTTGIIIISDDNADLEDRTEVEPSCNEIVTNSEPEVLTTA